ncbi:MAG: histidine kinase [Melioribacteraceae bacterium]|nr:histidine kinase [Melioribacteraceae bacterium]
MPDDIEIVGHFPRGLFVVFYILLSNLNTEGNLIFNSLLNKKLPWFYFPQKRLLTQLSFILMWTIVTIGIPFTIWYFYNGRSFTYPPFSVAAFVSSIILLLVVLGISLTINFFKHWQISLLDAEHYKQEKLKADYRVLQNQVNPHFLFNSLNVIVSEIKHNPNSAVEFTRRLSKVYRYVLQSKNHDLITLSKELEFIDSFIFLHKVRIGNALEYSVKISAETLEMQLPPLTLQILIENAIKHNIANKENVLKISIASGEDNKLIVSNNLQAIENADSTYTGLSNLSKRFELLKKDGFTYGEQEEKFVVTIPLIEE